MNLHALRDSRYQVHTTVTSHALAKAKDPLEMVEHVVRDLAHQMSSFIVRKRIQADRDVRSDSMTYRMDVYVLTPEELAALVDERAKQLLSSPGAFFHREQDHIR